MRVLITGAGGQLGRALLQHPARECEPVARTHDELDITDTRQIERFLLEQDITAVINTAAYTNVEAAEREPSAAYRANGEAPAILARACLQAGAHLVHVSTDFVFDGEASRPYLPTDTPHPLNVYGDSKLQGEQRVLEILGARACIVRTSWLYGPGGTNFVSKMLQLMTHNDRLRVVTDERSSPTSTATLAAALWSCVARTASGILHWSDAGIASRHDFAVEIGRTAQRLQLVQRMPDIIPVSSKEFSSAVRRPAYSVLDTSSTGAALGLKSTPWRESLRSALVGFRASLKVST